MSMENARQTEKDAAERHAQNRKLYMRVMGGMI